jgi:hypothetical protein
VRAFVSGSKILSASAVCFSLSDTCRPRPSRGAPRRALAVEQALPIFYAAGNPSAERQVVWRHSFAPHWGRNHVANRRGIEHRCHVTTGVSRIGCGQVVSLYVSFVAGAEKWGTWSWLPPAFFSCRFLPRRACSCGPRREALPLSVWRELRGKPLLLPAGAIRLVPVRSCVPLINPSSPLWGWLCSSTGGFRFRRTYLIA